VDRPPITTNLLGETVKFKLHGGGTDTGKVRAVYLSNNGWPMLLVQSGRELVVVSHDAATVVPDAR